MIDLDALEAKAKAATPGPWGHYGHRPHINVPDEVRAEDGTVIVTVHNDCDAAFIAAVNPATILALIAELRQARAERDWILQHINARGNFRVCPTIEKYEECHKTHIAEKLLSPVICRTCWLYAVRAAIGNKR